MKKIFLGIFTLLVIVIALVIYFKETSQGEKVFKFKEGGEVILPKKLDSSDTSLLGIDTNKNGIRDDVEIKLTEYVKTVSDYNKALKSAKAYQIILEKPSPSNREEALNIYSYHACGLRNGLSLSFNTSNPFSKRDIYKELIFNTIERKEKYSKLVRGLEGGLAGSELRDCDSITK